MTIEQLLGILEQFPNDSMTLYSIGHKYYEKGRDHFEQALEFLLRANKANDKHIATYLDLGNIYQDLSNIEMAKEMYQKGLEMIPHVAVDEGQDLKPVFEESLADLEETDSWD